MPDSLDSAKVRKEVGLPPLIFLFTMDQIAGMLGIDETQLKMKHIYFSGRSSGKLQRHQMYAVNISPEGQPAVWRVSQREFVRYLRAVGFRGYDLSSTWGAGT